MTINFGQDAPGLLRAFSIGGAVAAAAFCMLPLLGDLGWFLTALAVLCAVATLYLFGMAGLMIYESRIGKIRDRDAVLGLLDWPDDAVILDIGCGRGLMMLGALQHAPRGHATGVDLWLAKDQSGNSAAALLANARALGMADRVTALTADMRVLPFADDSFDVIVSGWAVHNLANLADRHQALSEMERVLKPGGKVVLTDIEGRADYQRACHDIDLTDISLVVLHPVKDRIVHMLSAGSFAPFSILATKRAAG